MSKIEELFNEYAVKIISNGIEGSGCIFQPNCAEYSYVFTAKHCLTDNNICDKDKVSIHRFNDLDKSMTIQNIYLHDEHDIAIIKVDKISELNISKILIPDKGQLVSIYGYPNILKGKNEPRHNINCKISFRRDYYLEIESDQGQFSFNKSMPETIVGFSGSGVFCEKENDLLIVGVLTQLKATDGVYNSLCAYHISLFEEFIIANGLPSLNIDNLANLLKDPEVLENVFALSYTLDTEPYYLVRNIDDQFTRLFNSPRNIWISGVSGLGKTYLVLRNLKKNSIKPTHIDLTCFGSEVINDFFEYINNELVEQNNIIDKSTKPNLYDNISENLSKINIQDQAIVIFVDEVPILDEPKFHGFLSGFISISEKFANLISKKNKIKWIISTRINPSNHLKSNDECLANKRKAYKNFFFRNFDLWEANEIIGLLKLLQIKLNFSISPFTQNKIINISKGLPGIVKSTIERVIIDDCTIDEAIEIVKSENI